MTAAAKPGRRTPFLAVFGILLIVTCGRTSIDRSHWQQMSPGEKTLYVRSLLGHDQAAESKGGQPPAHQQPAEAYVKAIDAAYAQGESRNADIVFETMGKPHR
jgi:hypothetical protein